MKNKLVFLIPVAFAAIAFELVDANYLTRSLAVGISIVIIFSSFAIFELSAKGAMRMSQLMLLGLPVLLLAIMLLLSIAMGIPHLFAWIIFGIAAAVCAGIVSYRREE